MSDITPDHHDIAPVSIEDEMRRSYLDYAMSVIVARALPDVRDGLKPVHRRILYAMKVGGYDWTRPYRKSARIVGDVMGQYHPHGDSAIYDAMVRMAQDFSMRLPLVDGQGNFGSMDGDPPAAMRYTEARLAKAAEGLLRDIDKETVDFVPNYDETTDEPSVLPAEYPNLLVNGAGGIAVGMATNIPPHNLGEVVDACLAMLDNPGITVDELMAHVPGPDFPTGGLILGRSGIREAYHTGRGSVIMRGRAEIEEIRKDRFAIVITEIPYQVNKARMIERIGEIVRDKTVEGIADLRDESDRDGVRVVVELKRDAIGEVVLNQLYRYTPLQTSFGVNMLALNRGRPEQMNLRDVIAAFVEFREEVITRRTRYLLHKARERAHVLAGLMVAINNLDAVIALIRSSPDAGEARRRLCETAWDARDVADFIAIIDDPGHRVLEDGTYLLSDAQARAILDLRLQRLTGMERSKLIEEAEDIAARIKDYLAILTSRPRLLEVLREELQATRDAWADDRRTEIQENEFEHDIEDLIAREDMVVTVSYSGYIKRVPLATYRSQKRGGKGRAGMATRDEDWVHRLFVANSHAPILFFTSRGQVYQLKTYRLPEGTPQSRGRPMVNLLPLEEGEWIQTVMPMPADEAGWGELHVMFATAAGTVRRNALSDFTNINRAGKRAMKLDDGDRLIAVMPCNEGDDVLLATRQGKAIRFQVADVRLFRGRDSLGVRGIKLAGGDEVVSMSILRHVDYRDVEGAEQSEREIYLRQAAWIRRGSGEGDEDATAPDVLLSEERFAVLGAAEEFVLSVTEKGYGKRTSAHEYRVTGRGGQGIASMDVTRKNGPVAAAFPVAPSDQIMLVTNGGQIIRCPVDDIRVAARKTQGVVLFRVGDEEKVVSVSLVGETGDDENGDADDSGGADGPDIGGSDIGGSDIGGADTGRADGGGGAEPGVDEGDTAE
ncbi:DNA gyrase subunit A [Thalassobaculum fulvum]|uniref:DNA gyrase subunit A n=2 Tax=Thalassobaculum fulvum TaxID=1633335 RepID=A0A918XR88_9PROT|nr:DNA gyrase subunit A [Thalassobaculum fulvum]GHD48107.1 DNA gyrase subunit A [Thalassobaculum fulvum]